MATFHGKDGVIQVGANAIASVVSWDYSEEVELIDKSAMGDTSKTYLSGMTDGGGTVECLFDPDDTDGQNAFVVDADITLNLYPEGAVTDDFAWTGTVRVQSIAYSGNKDGVPTCTFTYKNALTKGTVP